MRMLLICLLVAPVFAEKALVSFRLKKDPTAPLRGWILEFDDASFRFERLGGGRRVRVRWTDVVADDAALLRRRFKLELTEDERRGLVPGHRLHLTDGTVLVGRLERVDKNEKHFFRRRGFLLSFPRDRVARVEEVKVEDIEIFSRDEVYRRRLERTPPHTATQHRQLADHLFDIGNFKKSQAHYELALVQQPSLRRTLEGRMAEITAILAHAELAETLRKAKRAYRLNGEYDLARQLLKAYVESHGGDSRRIIAAIDEVNEAEEEERLRKFHFVKNEVFDHTVDRYLRRQQPSLSEALSWATSKLPKLMEERIREKMGLTEEQYREYLGTRTKSSPHWVSYWSGTFIFDSRARKGTTTKKAVRGNPDTWWARYPEAGTRGNLLRAYAVERLPDLFEVIEVRRPTCPKCGGKGQIKHMSITALSDGRHEWFQICPRCYGAKRDRSVAYR